MNNRGGEDVIMSGKDAPTDGIIESASIQPIDGDIPDPSVSPIRTQDRSRQKRVEIAVPVQIDSEPSGPAHGQHDHRRYGWSPSPTEYYHRTVRSHDNICIFFLLQTVIFFT